MGFTLSTIKIVFGRKNVNNSRFRGKYFLLRRKENISDWCCTNVETCEFEEFRVVHLRQLYVLRLNDSSTKISTALLQTIIVSTRQTNESLVD